MTDTEAPTPETVTPPPVAELNPRDLAATIEQLRWTIERDPTAAAAVFRLGECYARLGDFGQAIHAFERAIALRPDDLASYRSAASAALAQSEKAAAAGNSKAARDLKKFAAMYLLALGKRQHRLYLDAAEGSFREATLLDPKSAEAFWALGDFLQSRGHSSEAEKPLRRALALDSRMAHAYVSLGNTFQTRGRFEEMEAAYRKALALKPDLDEVRQGLETIPLVNMLYDDATTAAAIYARHRAWGDQFAARFKAVRAGAPPFANTREPDRKLRVAFLSPDFRYHAVSFFFQPLLAHLDRNAIEVFCYSDVEKPDVVTTFLKTLGGTWRDITTADDAALCAQFRRDEIDIAIDLAGHTNSKGLRALAMKPAPVSATWLGYPATTGLPTIDWRITDARADPPGQEQFHSEKLIRLPDTFLCYHGYMKPVPDVAPAPALVRGFITFGSFNSPHKMSPAAAAAWARILNAVPGSRLLLKAMAYVEPVRRQFYLDRFAALGIGPDRLEMRPPLPEMAAHLGSYGEIDIALDPFPYNGTTNTCEAMWMGVPVVSLIGDRHAGRVGFDLLSQVELTELAALDVDRYVATAVALAQDLPRLQRLRSELRDRMARAPLSDAPRFARAFEAALRAMWHQWCRE